MYNVISDEFGALSKSVHKSYCAYMRGKIGQGGIEQIIFDFSAAEENACKLKFEIKTENMYFESKVALNDNGITQLNDGTLNYANIKDHDVNITTKSIADMFFYYKKRCEGSYTCNR
jgi:hypothetical protein